MKLSLIIVIFGLFTAQVVLANDLTIAQESLEYNIVNTEEGPISGQGLINSQAYGYGISAIRFKACSI